MNQLHIWNDERIKKKMALCLENKVYNRAEREHYPFPLPDILFSFYRDANILEDFYSFDFLKKLLAEYKNNHKLFRKDAEELVEAGWISLSFGRWKQALHNLYAWEESEAANDWTFQDADIIQFLIWLKQENERNLSIEVIRPEEILNCWKTVCNTVPDLDWFIDHNYLVYQNTRYYAKAGPYWQNHAIDHALAKLWIKWRQNRRQDWITAALSLRGSCHINDYLEDAVQKELLDFILHDYIYQYPIPSWEEENRFFCKLYMAELPSHCKEPDKYGNREFWTGNRVIDLLNFEQYGFEYYRWNDARESEYGLLIVSCIIYAGYDQDMQSKKFINYLNGYDKISAFYYTPTLDVDTIYGLLTESGTLFIGLRYLIQNISDTELCPATYTGYIEEILGMIFAEGIRVNHFFQGEDIGNCLFYLIKNQHSKNGIWKKLLKSVSLIIGKEKHLYLYADELCIYFRKLLKLTYDVDWVCGYHLILFCVNQWFFEVPKQQETPYFRSFMDIVWEGYQIAFDGKSGYITFLKEEYFSQQLCSELYRLYMKEESAAKKRKLLLPTEHIQYPESDNKLCYFYRLLLSILYHIYENTKESFVKDMMFEALEQTLIAEDSTEKKAIFNYTHIQMFSTETIIGKCIRLLQYEDSNSAYLLKHLLEADVPELLIFYDAAEDSRLKEQILETINAKADKTSLNVFDDDHALDLVMDFQIESLYPAVEYMLAKKLNRWKNIEWVKNQSYYQKALHQQIRLKYCKKEYQDILNGNNLFFQAIVYMEADGYRDYKKAGRIWERMISDRKRQNYAGAVFLNYFSLLIRELIQAAEEQTGQQPEIIKKINRLVEIVEKEQIQKWTMEDKETFGWFVVQSKKILGGDYLHELYAYKEKYHLSISVNEFLNEPMKEPVRQNIYPTMDIDDVVNALRAFEAYDRVHKAQAYYQLKGYLEMPKKDCGTMMLTELVLRTCYALQNYSSQLIFKDKNAAGKLYEDGVTILFRELFNLAFGQFYNFTVHDQEKRATTGNFFGVHKSPAEIDLSVYYRDHSSEIMEAFVLKDDTSRSVFKDHIGKAIGNNTAHQPLTFMLVYGNAEDSDKAWQKYTDYIENLSDDFSGSLKRTSICKLESAPYYLEQFHDMFPGLGLLRHCVQLKSGREQEILHIYIDIAKNSEGMIRKECK